MYDVLPSMRGQMKVRFGPSSLLLITCCLQAFLFQLAVQAQLVIPAPDGTGTIVTPNNNRLDISGGQLSQDGMNLFHSFTELNLSRNQVANFLSNSQVQNILSRVTGGKLSWIDGTLQVSGSSAHLFLINPSGIVFGGNANLNLPGSFTATTANGIQFGSNWFNATGLNDYASLVGNPGAFAFTMPQPGGILTAANLSISSGNLTLLGGTTISTGQLSAPQGHILIAGVPGDKWVRINSSNQTIGLEIRSPDPGISQPINWLLPIATLPELLTSGSSTDFNSIEIAPDGQVGLGATAIESGDVVAQQVTAQAATLSATRNLTLVESQLNTTGNLSLLAGNTVLIRDSVVNPFVARAGGNLSIQGNQGIDILALNHPSTPFQSGGNLFLISDGIVSGDAHFASGGQFSIFNLAGQPGTFISLYDPIISSTGDVTFGDYVGVALKVETLGSINAGNITITGPDTSLVGSDPDIATLTSSRALILRAGLTTLSNSVNVAQTQQGTTFTATATTAPGTITARAIRTIAGQTEEVNGGPVILSAPNGIQADSIESFSSRRDGGAITLSSNSGASQVGNGGAISVNTNSGNVNTGSVDSSSETGSGGTVTVTANSGSINTGSVDSSSQTGNGGTVSINSNSGRTNTGSVDSSSQTGNGGTVLVNSNSGNINTGSVDSSSQTGNGGTVLVNSNSGNINTGSVDVSSQTGSTGTATFSSNSGNVATGSSSTNISVISTNNQGSASSTQPGKTVSGIPSDIPYSDLPENSRMPGLTAESIERQREKDFKDILGKNFPEKIEGHSVCTALAGKSV
jgi:filamentous hemagglutinin family protein